MIGSTELIQIRGFAWQRTTGAPEFNAFEQRLCKAMSDSAENKLDSVQFLFILMYNLHTIILLDINEMLKSSINKSKPK